MQIKNKFILLSLIFLFFCYNLNAEEFNISAKEMVIDKNSEILKASGNVKVTDMQGRIINATKATYEKNKEFLLPNVLFEKSVQRLRL